MRLLFRSLFLCSLALTLLGCGSLTRTPLALDQVPLVRAAPSNSQSPTPNRQLRVHFIDVGQGDSILVQAPDGATMLIDGGYSGTGALAYLKKLSKNWCRSNHTNRVHG